MRTNFIHAHLNFTDECKDRQLCTVPYLYSCMAAGTAPNLLQAISQHDRSFPLSLRDPNHIKFLMDISLQLSGQDCPEKLAQALHLKHYQLERIQYESPTDISWQVYSILREWLATNGYSGATTLGALKGALWKVEVTDIHISEPGDASSQAQGVSLISTSLDIIPIADPQVLEENFLLLLSEKIQCCWRKVGSLMGMPKSLLDIRAQENDQLHEQAYQMLLTWQKENWHNDATHGILFKAVQRLHKHHSDIVNDAWFYCIHYVEKNGHFTSMSET